MMKQSEPLVQLRKRGSEKKAKSADEYCSSVCGARCCRRGGEKCPHLTEENLCSIYEERFSPERGDIELILDGPGNPVWICARVTVAIEMGALEAGTTENCCYAHPELLEG